MAVVAKRCLEGEGRARNAPFFKSALSLWRRADSWASRVTTEFYGQRSVRLPRVSWQAQYVLR